MKTHTLKIWPNYFEAVRSKEKKFELRKRDRDFQEGDVLNLREFDPESRCYTGSIFSAEIKYILKNAPGLDPDYCILGF